MNCELKRLVVGAALIALLPGVTAATTRELAELQTTRLVFDQSILNQLTFDTYRDPFDELQTRPYNLLFTNIGRHPNLSPWQGQAGSYTRYLNALIGNTGVANVDNNADAISGSMVHRRSGGFAWGMSASYLSGTDGSSDTSSLSSFTDTDDLNGFELRGAAAFQLSETQVLGAGVRLNQASRDVVDASFEQGVGGFYGAELFDQYGAVFDVGLRQFRSAADSWEIQVIAGVGRAEQEDFNETLDDTGAITNRFVITNYEMSDLSLGVYGGYNRLRSKGPGEMAFRAGLERTQRDLGNNELSFIEDIAGVTPQVTLLAQDAVAMTRLHLSAQLVFPAGETEMFGGAQLSYGMVDGATQIDVLGTVVNEEIDDTRIQAGLTIGLRQGLFSDKLRFVVSGRADVVNQETNTIFDAATSGDDTTQTVAQYAIGLEGVLANVTFDLAWMLGEEAPVVPVALGLPAGSRRSVQVDRLVFSATVGW